MDIKDLLKDGVTEDQLNEAIEGIRAGFEPTQEHFNSYAQKNGLNVLTKEQLTESNESHLKKFKASMFGSMDNFVNKVTGVKRPDDMDSPEYWKTQLGTHLEGLTEAGALDTIKQQHAQDISNWESKYAELEANNNKYKADVFERDLRMDLMKGKNSLSLSEDYDSTTRGYILNGLENDFRTLYTVENNPDPNGGFFIVKNKEGQIQREDGKNLQPSDVIKRDAELKSDLKFTKSDKNPSGFSNAEQKELDIEEWRKSNGYSIMSFEYIYEREKKGLEVKKSDSYMKGYLQWKKEQGKN